MAEQEKNKNEQPENKVRQNSAAQEEQKRAAEENKERAAEAKQERQQPNGKKKDIHVEQKDENYVVKNAGDEAALYESPDRDASIDFANKVAEEHNVSVNVDQRVEREEKKEDQPAAEEKEKPRSEGRRYEEKRESEGPRNVIIEDDGKYYIVRNDGDRAKLYESEDKEASLDFARKVAKDHAVDLVMLDRDRNIVLEEHYNNGKDKERKEQAKPGDKEAEKR